MSSEYDENLLQNPFFILLKTEYLSLYQHVVAQSWTICVPRHGSCNVHLLTMDDIWAHILMPSEELPEFQYINLNHQHVTAFNRVVTLKEGEVQSDILFEEIYYNEDNNKLKIWCIERPLCKSLKSMVTIPKTIDTVNDAADFIWSMTNDSQVLQMIKESAQNNLCKVSGPNIDKLLKITEEIYNKCLNNILQIRSIQEKIEKYKITKTIFDCSVKTYLQSHLYDKVIQNINMITAYKDARFNKLTRNLSEITPQELNIGPDLNAAISNGSDTLSNIVELKTATEKINCIKDTLSVIDNTINPRLSLTVDDLIPFLVFLVIKSDIPNWYAQLEYMKHFRVSCISNSEVDESSFLMTSIEAVLAYIQTYKNQSSNLKDCNKEKTIDTINSKLDKDVIIQYIKNDDINEVKEILHYNNDLIKTTKSNLMRNLVPQFIEDGLIMKHEKPELCHPLCTCMHCSVDMLNKLYWGKLTILTKDFQGMTVMHFAAKFGRTKITEMLLSLGAEVDSRDRNDWTPLHYAAFHGHQHVLLLLMNHRADINKLNLDKNTPLHLAANNGHLNCVKALIYYSEYSNVKLDINCSNRDGNTCLHLAVRWGYIGIVKSLIDAGSEPSLTNKLNLSAFELTTNVNILAVLNQATPNLFDFVHINDLNIQSKSSAMIQTPTTPYKEVDKIYKIISYGDVKLACFYMNLEFDTPQREYDISDNKSKKVDIRDAQALTPLMVASKFGLTELLQILMDNGADIDLVDMEGNTALHHAIICKRIEAVNFLLNCNANVNIRNKSGNTALHEACYSNCDVIIKIFSHLNADFSIKNNVEQTPLDIAVSRNLPVIIKYIETLKKQSNI